MNQNISEENFPKKKSFGKKLKKKVKQKMYSWHRTLGIITVIPAILWCLSGIMHPFMAHFFKPQIANEKLELKPIDKNQLRLSVQEVLQKNGISEIKNFRIIQMNGVYFYQIKNLKDQLQYFSVNDAKILINGDQKYAEWLSRYFLDDQKSPIVSTTLQTEFTAQYKYVNRYLPVYKVTFDRDDAVDVYVETSSSKLATFNPKSRQAFIWIFDTFHNWSFIDWISNNSLRIVTMILFLSIIAFSAISGIVIYGFLWRQFKKAKEPKKSTRKYHRQFGIFISLFTLTFAFSGGYHALQKWTPNTLPKMVYEPTISVKDIIVPSNLISTKWERLTNFSVIKFKNQYFYQCHLMENDTTKSETQFVNATTNSVEKNTQFEYATFLATKFAKMQLNPKSNCCEMDGTEKTSCNTDMKLKNTSILSDFDKREYGFVNKRLPVVKLAFDTPENTTYYIETSTSRLAAVVTDSERLEGYSFAFFHKFLFMDWAGKNVRDFSMVLAAFFILLVSILGLILFLKRKSTN